MENGPARNHAMTHASEAEKRIIAEFVTVTFANAKLTRAERARRELNKNTNVA